MRERERERRKRRERRESQHVAVNASLCIRMCECQTLGSWSRGGGNNARPYS